jgi:Domain of unknown function (DUF4954)
VVVDNVNYMSHYIIGNDVMLVNINELATTSIAKFGNGILKDGEDESIRIWLEVCNENGGRKIIPFDGMLPGDAFLWSRHRDDRTLQDKFKAFTDAKFDKDRGFYGKIGDRTVIKNARIIKDVWIGTDAYIKGANKLKNLTIKSEPDAVSQIGEGCELVNGIVNAGCRIFYGVKAVRFFMASHSQLKYGARLINSYLGNNATISCCEVLNALIFPAHEQHHNNSFLCAALVMGQSNMAAGATLGSNHNSRAADGELIAGRGFWPGLCVSVKHNSRFASFTILAKGDYPAEIDLPIPFALLSHDVPNDRLIIMPAYWFMYNMYALARNAGKYVDRDRRTEKLQQIEYDFLAPDSISEMVQSLALLELWTGRAFFKHQGDIDERSDQQCIRKGRDLLTKKDPIVGQLHIVAAGIENSNRRTTVVKTQVAYNTFLDVLQYYCTGQIIEWLQRNNFKSLLVAERRLPQKFKATTWKNIGGQLIPEYQVDQLIKQVKNGQMKSWDDVHAFYKAQAADYPDQRLEHAIYMYKTVFNVDLRSDLRSALGGMLANAISTSKWMTENIFKSRAKDFTNPFRQMPYDSPGEMEAVVGSLEGNSFIEQERENAKQYQRLLRKMASQFKVSLAPVS